MFAVLIFEIIFLSFAIFILVSDSISQTQGAPYVPLPRKSINNILKFSEIKNSISFYDLGSGDGRVLIEAIKNFGVEKAIGYEVSPWPYWKSRFLISRVGLKEKIKIFRFDFTKADLRNADLVFLYLFPKLVQKSALKFKNELRFGSKVLCVSFKIENPGKFNLQLIKIGKIDRFNVFLYEKI